MTCHRADPSAEGRAKRLAVALGRSVAGYMDDGFSKPHVADRVVSPKHDDVFPGAEPVDSHRKSFQE